MLWCSRRWVKLQRSLCFELSCALQKKAKSGIFKPMPAVPDGLLRTTYFFFVFVKPFWFLGEFCGLWGMNALDCELGAWIQFFENMNSWKTWILETCEFRKNVNFGKMWILEKMWITRKWGFRELVNFGYAEFLESECWKIVGFCKMCGMGL